MKFRSAITLAAALLLGKLTDALLEASVPEAERKRSSLAVDFEREGTPRTAGRAKTDAERALQDSPAERAGPGPLPAGAGLAARFLRHRRRQLE